MSRPVAPIVCDGPGCSKQKQEANRWWVIGIVKPPAKLRISIYPYQPLQTKNSEWYDFCGETCLLKFISQEMGKVQG